MKKFIFLMGLFTSIVACSGKKEGLFKPSVQHDLPGTYINWVNGKLNVKIVIKPAQGIDSTNYFHYTLYDKLGKPYDNNLCKRTNDTLITYNEVGPPSYYKIGDNNSSLDQLEINPMDYHMHYKRVKDK